MASKADEYRANAVECNQRAAVARSREVKTKLEELARDWHKMANKADRILRKAGYAGIIMRIVPFATSKDTMVNFEQTDIIRCPKIQRGPTNGNSVTIMAYPKIDKHKDYARYAAHCLEMVTMASDRESRMIQREMAAEWLRLADEFIVRQ